MSIGFGFFPFHNRPQGLKGKNYENKNYSDNSENPIFPVNKTIGKAKGGEIRPLFFQNKHNAIYGIIHKVRKYTANSKTVLIITPTVLFLCRAYRERSHTARRCSSQNILRSYCGSVRKNQHRLAND